MKKLLILLLVTVFLISGAGGALAHSSSQKGLVDGHESIGWRIDESAHSNKTSSTSVRVEYMVNYNTAGWNSYFDPIITQGVNQWASLAQFVEVSNSNKKIEMNRLSEDLVARLRGSYTVDSNGHFLSWTIDFNSLYFPNSYDGILIGKDTVAHELGHVLGLLDLYNTSNKNKIMYGLEKTRTVESPQAKDLMGARVITGIHSHSAWNYTYYDRPSSTQTRHKRYCTSCQGFKYLNCVYLSNVCKYCGASKYPAA